MTVQKRKKLIEVALPLDAINEALRGRNRSAMATHHLAPVVGAAAARGGAGGDLCADGGRPRGSVGAEPGRFPRREGRTSSAQRLFEHHRGSGEVGEHDQREGAARGTRRDLAELATSWPKTPTTPVRRNCLTGTNCPHSTIPLPGAASLPLEAQRLGLEAYASDLNPVAVLINKAMIEIPPKFAGSHR